MTISQYLEISHSLLVINDFGDDVDP